MARWSKATYEMTADIIKRHLWLAENTHSPATVSHTMQDVAKSFSDIFAANNPRFDRARFLKACGVED